MREKHTFTSTEDQDELELADQRPGYEDIYNLQIANRHMLKSQRTADAYPPASPHRVGHTPGLHGEDAPYSSQEFRQTGQRPARYEAGEEDEVYRAATRLPTSSRRYTIKIPATKQTRIIRESHSRRTRFHRLVFVGLAMFAMILGWLAFSALSSWWTVQLDDWHYGRPRTYQTDAVVGHEDSASNPSHFIAINLNRKVIVLEVPGGDTAHSQIYLGPTLFGAGQELTPITLSFEDRNGDGKPDLNIHIGDHILVFVNIGQKFVATQQQP